MIIVAFNGADEVGGLLSSLQQCRGVNCKPIVVDNASSDATVDLASGLGATVISNIDNLGYGAAFNRGLAVSTSEWVVCSNQDVVVHPSAVQTLLRAAAAHEAATGAPCLAGPGLRDNDDELVETFHNLPSLWHQVVELLGGESLAGRRSQTPTSAGPQQCGWMSAAFILGRRSTFRALGGFDPAYFMYCEDVDLFARLSDIGGHGLWVPEATVTHSGGVRGTVSPALVAHAAWGWGRYFGQRHGRAATITVLLAGLVGGLLRMSKWAIRAAIGAPDATETFAWFTEVTRRQLKTVVAGKRPPVPT